MWAVQGAIGYGAMLVKPTVFCGLTGSQGPSGNSICQDRTPQMTAFNLLRNIHLGCRDMAF
jgi:hypothetical protein